jgi:hypothetical protein
MIDKRKERAVGDLLATATGTISTPKRIGVSMSVVQRIKGANA